MLEHSLHSVSTPGLKAVAVPTTRSAPPEADGYREDEAAPADGAGGIGHNVWGRVLRGPSGLGTADLYLAQRAQPSMPSREIPGLYYHPVGEPDEVRVAEVGRRIKDWAVDEVALFPPEWED
ncbi:2-methylisoborneol synthase, partial [Embleya sp. NPDC059237]